MFELNQVQQRTYETLKAGDPASAERYKAFQFEQAEKRAKRYRKRDKKPNHTCQLESCQKPFYSNARSRKYCSRKCSEKGQVRHKGENMSNKKFWLDC